MRAKRAFITTLVSSLKETDAPWRGSLEAMRLGLRYGRCCWRGEVLIPLVWVGGGRGGDTCGLANPSFRPRRWPG
ncbi:hypothetical protein E2C01_058095 [Portunus trituberculatus]|uniref:Uncharacterized protein n=1 Tax=Portunus trituberculatus TaxID=210409 RepID=A0A5B7H2U7_PORTR|nr:hypothetical protein [Portunus trituberculatus]